MRFVFALATAAALRMTPADDDLLQKYVPNESACRGYTKILHADKGNQGGWCEAYQPVCKSKYGIVLPYCNKAEREKYAARCVKEENNPNARE